MSTTKPQTASFMVRFSQNIYDDDEGRSNVQWRGKISHVQGGENKSFTDFQDVVVFIQDKLATLTKESVEDKSPEEQEGILMKSLDLWKKWSVTAPKMVIETIKDPKKQVAQIQDQLTHVGDEINSKIEEAWPAATKGDIKNLASSLQDITKALNRIDKKVNDLAKKVK